MAARLFSCLLVLFLTTACSGGQPSGELALLQRRLPITALSPADMPFIPPRHFQGSEAIMISLGPDGSIALHSTNGPAMLDILSLDPDLLNPEIASFLFPSCVPSFAEVRQR